MKLRVRSTDTELSFFETLALAIYFMVEINVELAVHRPIYIAAVLFLVLSILLSNRSYWRVNYYMVWTILWLSVVGFSMFWSIYPSTTFTAFLTVGARGLAFISIISRVNTKELLIRIVKILFIVEFFNILYVLSKVNVFMLGSKRIGAIVNMDSDITWNSNTISAVLAECVNISLYLLRKWEIKNRKLTILVTAFYSVIILLCGSRMGLFLLIGVPLVWLGLSSNIRNFLFRVIGVIAIISIVYMMIMYIPALYNVLGRRVSALILGILGRGSGDLSMVGRSNLVSYGIDWIIERPIFGYGMYTYKDQLLTYFGYSMYSHNSYIEIMFGTGIIGLISYYSLYLYMLVQSMKYKYRNWPIVCSSIIVIMIAEMATVSFKKFAFQFALVIVFLIHREGKEELKNNDYQTSFSDHV